MQNGWATAAAAVLYAAGGFSLAMQFYMRILNRWYAARWKHVIGRVVIFGLPLASGLGGAAAGWTPWAAVPAAALLFHIALERASVRARRSMRAEPPVEIGGAAPGRWITTRDLQVLRYEAPSPWPGSPRVRIAHASDLHFHDGTDAAYFRSVAAQLASAAPDLVVLTGDYVFRQPESARLRDWLAGLSAPAGIWAVLGNHDYAASPGSVRAALEAGGVRVLAGRTRRADLGGGRAVDLCGDDRPWAETRPDPLRAEPGIPLIGLSHSPDNAPDFAAAGAWAVFSGHLHGGHIRLPWFGAVALPSRHGRCFEHGRYRIGTTHLFVSAGVGSTYPAFRLRCPPDVLLVDLV